MVTKKQKPRRGEKLPEFRPLVGEHMAAKGIDDADLAHKVGVDRVTVTRWRNVKRIPKYEEIPPLTKAFGYSDPTRLFRLPDAPSLDDMAEDSGEGVKDAILKIIAPKKK